MSMALAELKVEKSVWIVIIVASAVAAITFNSVAFGLTALRIYDSSVHTFFIASCVATMVIAIDFRLRDKSLWIRLLSIALLILPTTYLGVWMASFWLYYINPFQPYRNLGPSSRTYIFSLAISYIFGLGGYFIISARSNLKTARETIARKDESERVAKSLATEARLNSLESRIQPHFLFNTLNSISALIRDNPAQAEEMVGRLSRVLRSSLYEKGDSFTTLRNEIELVEDFLGIQQARFGNRLVSEINIPANLKNQLLPPFSVQSLVENSIKHVVSKRRDQTRIVITAENMGNDFRISVADGGPGIESRNLTEGHGLESLKQRCEVLFESKDDFIHIDKPNGVISLVFPKDTE